jgi:signal transduction histidine kinase/ligand-binding sensor domain-containing protein
MLVFIFQFSFAQKENLRFTHISNLDGLSQSWVRCIFQDDLGFMWFGTADGLNRFDGYEFKVFLPNPDDRYSLGSMYINNISKKSQTELWICAHDGVYHYDQKLERFYRFNPVPDVETRMVFEDSEKIIWVATTNGLYKYNPKKNSTEVFTHKHDLPGSISNNNIQYIFEDSKKNLWISTYEGIDLYNRKSNTFKFFDISKSINLKDRTRVWNILEDKKGRLWCGIKQGGVYMFEYNLKNPELSSFKLILKGSPNCMVFDNNNNLWIGHGGSQGLGIFNIDEFDKNQKPNVSQYFHTGIDDLSISSNSITSIYKDRFGDIWIGNYGGGVNYYSKRAKKFYCNRFSKEKNSISSNMVNAILEDNHYLWIGTEYGLDKKDLKTGEFVHFKHDKLNSASIGADAIYSLFKDSKGNLWVGSWNGGLSKYEYISGGFKNYLPNKSKGSINNSNIIDICEDKKGRLWITTNGGGVNQFDPTTEKFVSFTNNPLDKKSINSNSANNICITRSGQIFISLYGKGFDLFDESTNTFTHFCNNPKDKNSLSPGFVLSIFEDSKQNIWVATNMGLNLFDQKNGTFKHYTTQHGLPNNTIQAILEDNKGNLWISTNNGLAVFYDAINKPKDPKFKVYNKKDGFFSDEFNIRAAFKGESGVFYYGTLQGYIYFNPDSIKENTIPPVIILTDFSLLETQEKTTDKQKLFSKEINYVDTIKLSYSQSNFTIKFAALNYLDPIKNQYKYRLSGYEDGWHMTGNQRFATYTNIQPGEYTFIVYGSNNDGVWSINPKTIKIIISPPWWQTLLFKIVVILSILLVIAMIFRFRMKILQRQKQILEKKVEQRTVELKKTNQQLEEKNVEIAVQNDELSRHRNNLEQLVQERTSELEAAKLKAEESDKLKSAFLANMSHEIRTPMNAILGFANLLDFDNLSSEERSRFIKMININSETLMVLIDDIIDISLIESNQLILKISEFDAAKVLAELETVCKINNNKNLEIEFENKGEKLILQSDIVRFRQVFNNLLNNAIKYTESGSVKFGYHKFEKEVHFYIADTGIGIAPEQIGNIFNYFNKVQLKNRKIYRGTGIGLSICKNLLSKLGGKIWAESELGKGSIFRFTLPLK